MPICCARPSTDRLATDVPTADTESAQTSPRRVDPEDLRVTVRRQRCGDLVGDRTIAEHPDRRSAPTQPCTPCTRRDAGLDGVRRARHRRQALRLVQPIVGRTAQQGGVVVGERQDELRRSGDVVDGVGARRRGRAACAVTRWSRWSRRAPRRRTPPRTAPVRVRTGWRGRRRTRRHHRAATPRRCRRDLRVRLSQPGSRPQRSSIASPTPAPRRAQRRRHAPHR